MKPEDLKAPFKWENRRIHLENGLLYIPEYYDCSECETLNWSSMEIFGNNNNVCVEYCSGNGQWVVDQAQKNPHINWVALEKRFDRVRKIWSKRENLGIKNLFIICGEAQPFAKYFVEDNSINAVYVNFPDPWPKDRHAKHRLIKQDFVSDCARNLKNEGVLILVTDDDIYRDQMINVVGSEPRLTSKYGSPYYVQDIEGYGDSYFYKLWVNLDRKINYMHFIKKI